MYVIFLFFWHLEAIINVRGAGSKLVRRWRTGRLKDASFALAKALSWERAQGGKFPKRDHSFEGRIPLKVKDDDLALFSEMQNHERDNFLLHAYDDFDESICNEYLLSILEFFPFFVAFALLIILIVLIYQPFLFHIISTIEIFFGFQDWGHCTNRRRVQRSPQCSW